MTQTERTKHISMLRMLEPVVLALQKHGIHAWHECPGYVQIKGCDFVFAPGTHHWLWIHKQGNTWTLMDVQDHGDAEQIADSITTFLQ